MLLKWGLVDEKRKLRGTSVAQHYSKKHLQCWLLQNKTFTVTQYMYSETHFAVTVNKQNKKRHQSNEYQCKQSQHLVCRDVEPIHILCWILWTHTPRVSNANSAPKTTSSVNSKPTCGPSPWRGLRRRSGDVIIKQQKSTLGGGQMGDHVHDHSLTVCWSNHDYKTQKTNKKMTVRHVLFLTLL